MVIQKGNIALKYARAYYIYMSKPSNREDILNAERVQILQ